MKKLYLTDRKLDKYYKSYRILDPYLNLKNMDFLKKF